MSSKNIVKVYSLSKITKETKKIRMFQADLQTLSNFRVLSREVASLFGMYDNVTGFFSKGT